MTHVILTFVPASFKDVKMFMSTHNATDEHSANVFNKTEDVSHVSRNEDDALVLPVYVYDCPLGVLINSYINPEKNIRNNKIKDVYENHAYKSADYFKEFLKFKNETTIHRSEVKHDDSDVAAGICNSSISQHCETLVLIHSKCFVASLFKSLRCKIPVHHLDVQSAVDQCEETIDEIDITEYLRVN